MQLTPRFIYATAIVLPSYTSNARSSRYGGALRGIVSALLAFPASTFDDALLPTIASLDRMVSCFGLRWATRQDVRLAVPLDCRPNPGELLGIDSTWPLATRCHAPGRKVAMPG
jgi:hypothetical protein